MVWGLGGVQGLWWWGSTGGRQARAQGSQRQSRILESDEWVLEEVVGGSKRRLVAQGSGIRWQEKEGD